jgi:hypothetical protein
MMTKKEIEDIYMTIKDYHERYLKDKDITLPKLERNGNYVKDSLALVYLAKDYPNTKVVSKEELTSFFKIFYPDTNDVQQARHLSRQKGWYILSGQRGDITKENIPSGSYKLVTLEEVYPGFNSHRITTFTDDFWTDLKNVYNNRCASCGSKENEKNFINPSSTTQLQKGHMNPELPLEQGNIIPQCQECNRGDRNRWIYDERGRVVGITKEALLQRIKKVNKDTALVIVDYLKSKFKI